MPLYVDDSTISYSSDNMEVLLAFFNSELSHLNRRLQSNKLPLNIIKTQAMTIGSKHKLSDMKQTYSAIPRFYPVGLVQMVSLSVLIWVQIHLDLF